MAIILNVVFDENNYIQSYATIGTIDGGINVAIEEDIPEEDLFDKFSCYKLSDEDITVTIPKKDESEQLVVTSHSNENSKDSSVENGNDSEDSKTENPDDNTENDLKDNNNTEEIVVKKLIFDETKYEIKHNNDISNKLNRQYIPSEKQSMLSAVKMLLPKTEELDNDQKLLLSGLYESWDYGKHTIGEIKNSDGQTWECYQDHDTEMNPDIIPSNVAWYTFWKPLHGKTKETARPYVPVQGSHDMYRTGEYMIFTDGYIYECLQDTNFSPTDYASAWKKHELYV